MQWILNLLGVGEFLPSNALMDWFASKVCGEDELPAICSNIVFLLCGYDTQELNKTMLNTLISHTPAGASTYTILQYAQQVKSGKEGHKY